MDSTELLRASRTERQAFSLIAASGVEERPEWLRIAEQLGAFASLGKPVFARQLLLQCVEQALNRPAVSALA